MSKQQLNKKYQIIHQNIARELGTTERVVSLIRGLYWQKQHNLKTREQITNKLLASEKKLWILAAGFMQAVDDAKFKRLVGSVKEEVENG